MFFIREHGKNGNRNKITIYNKKNITIDIDQDPINQLVFECFKPVKIIKSSGSLQLQTSHINFRYLQLHTELTAASEKYLHATDIQRPTFFSSSTEVFIEEMKRWDERKDL